MDATFEYRRIGPRFQVELLGIVSRGLSAALLGPRDLGKRFVLRMLAGALREKSGLFVVEVKFLQEPALVETAEVTQLLEDAMGSERQRKSSAEHSHEGQLLGGIRELCEQMPGRVVLIASNVDSLAHHLVQAFLREVRVLVTDPQLSLIAVLTGEEDLTDLVHGPESEFNCAYQFMLQGFEEEEFLGYMRSRGNAVGVTDEAQLRRLFTQTNGNIHLAQAVLWSWLYLQSRTPRPAPGNQVGQDFDRFLTEFGKSKEAGTEIFLHAIRVVAAAPRQAWSVLESLRAEIPVAVPVQSAPHALEFAGIAVRSQGRLVYASPMMAQFAERYYDACCLGDLHALDGDWAGAFQRYKKMPPSRQRRPAGTADVPRLARVVKAMVAEMHMLAGTRPSAERQDELKKFLVEAGRLVLGVSDISFWQFRERWEPHESQELDPRARNQAVDSLEIASRQHGNWIGVISVKRAVIAKLPSLRSDRRDAVVVSDAGLPLAVSKERDKLLRELLGQFISAYDHAVASRQTELRLESRRRHLEIATSIVNALGTTVVDPGTALHAAGDQLLKLGYRRIMFALVDAKRRRINGVQFICGDKFEKDVAEGTNWPLNQWRKDIQPWVVHRKQACCVRDWRTWNKRRSRGQPRINDTLAQAAGTALNFAVVPMFLRTAGSRELVYGTIHVERKDGLPPADEDIADLIELGRQMAALLRKTEQVSALLDALQFDEDAVVIFDEECHVRFANAAGARRFAIKAGWHDVASGIFLAEESHMRRVREVVANGKPIAEHVTNEKQRREAVFCAPLKEWRGPARSAVQLETSVHHAVGAVLHIHDFMGFERVFAALQIVAKKATNRESAIAAILESAEALQLSSGSVRLYLVDPDQPDVLCSVRASGLSAEHASLFASGAFRKSRHDPDCGDTWVSLITGQPIVCQWNPDAKAPRETTTDRGMRVHNLTRPTFDQPWKARGDVWIDLPLLAPGAPIGKLTMSLARNYECNLEPEDYELLKLYSSLLGALLTALDKDKWVREASERAVAEAAHKIGTRLASLSGIAADICRAAPGNDDVAQVTSRMESNVRGCYALVKEVNVTFTAGKGLQREPTPVKALLLSALESILGSDCRGGTASAVVECPDSLNFSLDRARFGHAIEAMLANSSAMRASGRNLRLELRAESFTRDNLGWLRVTLADNGRGITPERREAIFDPFYSYRPGGRRSTGLGLTFVQRVVKGHGGTVAVVEPDGCGAKFVIELPEKS